MKAVPFSGSDDNGRRYVRFTERNLPEGAAVCLIDTKSNIGVINIFNADEIENCTIGVGEKNRSSIRLAGKQRPLKQGETMQLHHTFRIVDNADELIK